MLVQSSLPNPAALVQSSGLRPAASSPASYGPLEYIYNVSASLFPTPSQLGSTHPTSSVRLIALPSSPSSFGMINSSRSGNAGALWFETGSYSASIAVQIQKRTCSTNCSTVPLLWNSPTRVASFSAPISSDALVAVGNTLVVAASGGGTTYLYQSANLGQTWRSLGTSISGVVNSVAATPSEVSVATLGITSVSVTSRTLTGSSVGQVTLTPSGSGATGILQTGSTTVPYGSTYLQATIFSVLGSDQIQLATSTNGGASYTAPTAVATFGVLTPDPRLSSIGATRLAPAASTPGQVALTSIGSGLFLAYTTQTASGQAQVMTEASSNGGQSWNGPYASGPVYGAVQNLSLSVSPAGLVYATWIDPYYGSGGIDEAIYFPDGMPLSEPSALAGTGIPTNTPSGAPAIAVDGFQRPMLAWPSPNPATSNAISFTGDFPSVNESLSLINLAVTDPLAPANFNPSTSTTQSNFNTSVASAIATASSYTAQASNLCNLQNWTALRLYANVTHVALSVLKSGTVCASSLKPNNQTSPIAPTVGPFAPNTYLAVYADWLLESEGVPVGVTPLANQSATVQTVSSLPSSASNQLSYSGQLESVTVTPSLYGPTSFQLGTSASIPSKFSGLANANYRVICNGAWNEVYYKWWTNLTSTSVSVSINGGTAHVFSGTTSYPSPVWVTNLTPYQTYTWTAKFTASYSEYMWAYAGPCVVDWGPVSPVTDGPSTESLSVPSSGSGSVTTTLSITNGGAVVQASFGSGSKTATISYSWGTTMPATGSGTLYNQTTGKYATVSPGTSYQLSQNLPVNPAGTSGNIYSASITATSRAGTGVPTGSSPVIAYDPGMTAPAQTATSSCGFTLSPPGFVIWGNSTSNDTATSALFSWYANTSGTGFVTLSESTWGGITESVSSIPGKLVSGGTRLYSVELDDLEPWTTYSVTYGISYGSGCVVDSVHANAPDSIVTPPVFPVWEQDLPYDSVGHVGGGAEIQWSLPSWFVGETPSLSSGCLGFKDIRNGSQFVVPIASSSEIIRPVGSATNFGFNVTLPTLNDTYSVSVYLNYTALSRAVNATGSATFVYERDSSGDGLTDVEKEAGWTIPLPYTQVPGGRPVNTCPPSSCIAPSEAVVTANPAKFSTNGLVSDFVEKELGLDPNTLDTAESQMLDTWNLTFAVSWSLLNSGWDVYNLWNESTTYRPFSSNVLYAPGLHEKGYPLATNIANLTPNPKNGIYSGDGSPWAAEVLWSGQAFQMLWGVWTQLESEISGVDFLRAVEGQWNGTPTLTVWGKLSWGANPLAVSTSNDGAPDGAQVNPLGGTDLQVTLTGWKDTANAAGNGVSAFVAANSSATYYSAARTDYGGYSVQVSAGSGGTANFPSSTSPKSFVVTFPVTNTEQFAYLNLSLVQNESTSNSPNTVYAIASTPHYKVDLANGQLQSVSYPSAGATPSISFTYQVLPVYSKAPTWILAPPNNSTLSPLPTGLSRYTAEQDFDLLVLNDTAPPGTNASKIAISGVFGPQSNWKYTVTLLPGLNNLLIPRAMFLASPLGQTLINATASAKVPSQHQDSSLTFNPYNWLPRVLNTSTNRPSSAGFIHVFSNTTQIYSGIDPSAFGGVASNPSLENGYQSRQVQAVFWINVSSAGYNSNLTTSAAELNDLLGGLLLNQSGNLTGNLINETAGLPALGLSSNVVTTLANATYRNDGAYGTPVSTSQPPPPSKPWWDVAASYVWNAVSGVVTVVAKLFSVGWNGIAAAAAYLADAAAALASKLGITALVSQTVTALRAIGTAMWTVLQALLNYIISFVKAILATAFAPLQAAISAYGSSVSVGLSGAVSDTVAGKAVSEAHAASFWNALLGPLFLTGIAIAVVAEVVIGILMGLSLGAGLLVGIVVGLIVSAVLQAIESSTSPNTSGLSKVTFINAVAIHATEGVANSTSPPAKNDGNWTTNWNALAGVADWTATLLSTQIGLGLLAAAYFQGDGLILPSVAFGLALVSIALGIAGASGNRLVQETSLGVSGTSVTLDLIDFAIYPADRSGPLLVLNALTAGLDFTSLGIGLGEFHEGS